MINKTGIFLIILTLVLMVGGCQSELNSPDRFQTADLELYKFETVESDLVLLKNCGMRVVEGDGVFSIGWNEIFRPFDDDSHIKGMAFAVAFGDESTNSSNFPRFGIDMGTITIGYSGNDIEMHKMSHDRRGIAYSLFHRPFGGSDVLLDYIPNTEYSFDVSGSEVFSPVMITFTSPEALIDITSHSHGNAIDPTQDLEISWDGGNTEGTIAIRVMAHFRPMDRQRGPNGQGGPRDHRRPHPGPHHNQILVEILDNNPGQFTITAETLQNILSETDADKIVVGVSQFEMSEIEHDGKILNTAIRNGSSVMLDIQ
jgi:hypothetical protein